jgi:hypothetical protein
VYHPVLAGLTFSNQNELFDLKYFKYNIQIEHRFQRPQDHKNESKGLFEDLE